MPRYQFRVNETSHDCKDTEGEEAPALAERCPYCGAYHTGITRTGSAKLVNDREYHAPARLDCCEREGTIILYLSTIFGATEDRVMTRQALARVY